MDITLDQFAQDLARAGYAKDTQKRYVDVIAIVSKRRPKSLAAWTGDDVREAVDWLASLGRSGAEIRPTLAPTARNHGHGTKIRQIRHGDPTDVGANCAKWRSQWRSEWRSDRRWRQLREITPRPVEIRPTLAPTARNHAGAEIRPTLAGAWATGRGDPGGVEIRATLAASARSQVEGWPRPGPKVAWPHAVSDFFNDSNVFIVAHKVN